MNKVAVLAGGINGDTSTSTWLNMDKARGNLITRSYTCKNIPQIHDIKTEASLINQWEDELNAVKLVRSNISFPGIIWGNIVSTIYGLFVSINLHWLVKSILAGHLAHFWGLGTHRDTPCMLTL